MTGVLIKRTLDTDNTDVTRQGEDCPLQAKERSLKQIFPSQPSEPTLPTPSSQFWPSELRHNKCLLFKPPVWILCFGSSSRLTYTPRQGDLLYLLAPLLLALIDVEGQKDTTKKGDIAVYLSLQPCLLTPRLEYIQELRQEGVLGQSFPSPLPPGPHIFSSCEQYVSEEFLPVNNFTY